jgi:hypothetical protein
MSVILLVLGILITAAGVAAIAFGVPTNESGLGQSLIIAGATGLVGGPILVGLSAALSQLAQIIEALKARPAAAARAAEAKQPVAEVRRKVEMPTVPEPRALEPRVPAAPEPRVVAEPRAPEPRIAAVELRVPAEPRPAEPPRAPEPAPTIDVSASAIERLRSTMPRPDRVVTQVEEVPLSPNGSGHPPPEPLPEPRPSAAPGAAVEAREPRGEPREPRLDFLFRSRGPRPPQPDSFDSMWPKRGVARPAPDQPRSDEVARQPAPPAPPVEERRAPPPTAEEARSVAILKSGVVDGMAYTLYADGSIEAQLPHGTVRFGSIAELRAHIENNS